MRSTSGSYEESEVLAAARSSLTYASMAKRKEYGGGKSRRRELFFLVCNELSLSLSRSDDQPPTLFLIFQIGYFVDFKFTFSKESLIRGSSDR